MEVCENKNRNNGWIRVIILIALGVLIAIGGALRVEAAPLENYVVSWSMDVYNNNSFDVWNNTQTTYYSYSSLDKDAIDYFVVKKSGTEQYGFYLFSYEPIDISVKISTDIEKSDGSKNENVIAKVMSSIQVNIYYI